MSSCSKTLYHFVCVCSNAFLYELRAIGFLLGHSPILSHVNATLQGLPTVRACDATEALEKEFHEFQDRNSSCNYLFSCASIWFAVWLDIICLLFTASVTYSFLLLQDSKRNSVIGIFHSIHF